MSKEVTLDMSIDDLAAQRDSLIKALAAEYGVDPSQISLDASAGSLVLIITIAASQDASATFTADALIAAMNNVDDALLGASIGAALGTAPLNVSTSVQPRQGSIQRTIEFRCPRGKWCTAGLIVDCTEGYYNPLEGQDTGTACIKCPEYSTSPIASTNVTDCVCQDGFIQSFSADGTARCECDAGKEIMNGVRCDACQPGTYKPLPGNTKCTECRNNPDPLAAKEFMTTVAPGAAEAAKCVCSVGYYLVASAAGVAVCKPCSGTWFQGREGTDCSVPGITIETLPVLPGFYRQSDTAEKVRKCINIDANAACLGTTKCENGI